MSCDWSLLTRTPLHTISLVSSGNPRLPTPSCLKETINYYTERGSNVYVFCSFLDASKAFDRLVHAGLFLKLYFSRHYDLLVF